MRTGGRAWLVTAIRTVAVVVVNGGEGYLDGWMGNAAEGSGILVEFCNCGHLAIVSIQARSQGSKHTFRSNASRTGRSLARGSQNSGGACRDAQEDEQIPRALHVHGIELC